jgi:hypothetical protein
MRAFFPFKVNHALAQMHVRPNQFDGYWRSGMQQIGYNAGNTPKETALAIVAHGLGISFPLEAEQVIGGWIRSGKVDRRKPEMIEALQKLGFNIG